MNKPRIAPVAPPPPPLAAIAPTPARPKPGPAPVQVAKPTAPVFLDAAQVRADNPFAQGILSRGPSVDPDLAPRTVARRANEAAPRAATPKTALAAARPRVASSPSGKPPVKLIPRATTPVGKATVKRAPSTPSTAAIGAITSVAQPAPSVIVRPDRPIVAVPAYRGEPSPVLDLARRTPVLRNAVRTAARAAARTMGASAVTAGLGLLGAWFQRNKLRGQQADEQKKIDAELARRISALAGEIEALEKQGKPAFLNTRITTGHTVAWDPIERTIFFAMSVMPSKVLEVSVGEHPLPDQGDHEEDLRDNCAGVQIVTTLHVQSTPVHLE